MSKQPIFLSLFVALGVAVVSPAEATPYKALGIDELSEKADLIVRGHVVSKTARRTDKGGIYTEIELKLADIWKGDHNQQRLKIIQAGGVLGDRQMLVTGQSDYRLGEQVVSFLVLNDRNEAVTLASFQGKFHVWKRENDDLLYAQNGLLGVPPKTTNESRHRHSAFAPSSHHHHPHQGDARPGYLKLTDLEQRVKETAK